MKKATLVDEGWHKLGAPDCRPEQATAYITCKLRQLDEIRSKEDLSDNVLNNLDDCKDQFSLLMKSISTDDYYPQYIFTNRLLELIQIEIEQVREDG
ncbi:hypothetical protein HCH_03063 [Hahella chejuensis KCTC 2396]|uniref:Uncharacterized protein n=1 Tax=Hahella chejuensis (strain KCTC 2396) TaxID=349521 RepID=Q2SHP5_HAHCH|nr:hypothetical protein [Hahella chejuensis]ABC29829.1 hypothetical protein HCH_03063 [Hahella chejuensis KCTC 2396]